MKSLSPALIPLLLLLGACSTTTTTESASVDHNPAVRAGAKVTHWGELPSYELAGHRFTNMAAPNLGSRMINGAVTLDLLVKADGTVWDVDIHESSGDATVDEAVANSFRKARYSMVLGPDDPAQHVVRYTINLKTAPADSRPIDMTNYSQLGPQPGR